MTREIPLTRGMVALVDDEDYGWLSQWKWYYSGRGYVCRNVRRDGKNVLLPMHRVIMGEPVGLEVDHKNHNKLDCRRANLRIATHAQNQQNGKKQKTNTSSRYKGVSRHRRTTRWVGGIGYRGRWTYLGVFLTEEDAARAYDAKACEYFGEFACLNFPEEVTR